jgi:hypothetical protein
VAYWKCSEGNSLKAIKIPTLDRKVHIMAHVELTFDPNTEILEAIEEGTEVVISTIYYALEGMVVMDVSIDTYVAPVTVDLDVDTADEDAVMRRLGNGIVEGVEVDEMVHSVDWEAGKLIINAE